VNSIDSVSIRVLISLNSSSAAATSSLNVTNRIAMSLESRIIVFYVHACDSGRGWRIAIHIRTLQFQSHRSCRNIHMGEPYDPVLGSYSAASHTPFGG
jgi:hypothetical protein